jgi:hypothetical protein
MILIWKRASSGGVKYAVPVKVLHEKHKIPPDLVKEFGQPKIKARLKHLLQSVDLNK